MSPRSWLKDTNTRRLVYKKTWLIHRWYTYLSENWPDDFPGDEGRYDVPGCHGSYRQLPLDNYGRVKKGKSKRIFLPVLCDCYKRWFTLFSDPWSLVERERPEC